MTAWRLLIVTTLACLLSAGARAEDKADNAKRLIGKWEVVKADEGTVSTGSIVEFTKDGTLKLTIKTNDKDVNLEGTYKAEGDKFKMTVKINNEEKSQTITIKKLTKDMLSTTDEEGKIVDLKRKVD